jgi:hypothetical protein
MATTNFSTAYADCVLHFGKSRIEWRSVLMMIIYNWEEKTDVKCLWWSVVKWLFHFSIVSNILPFHNFYRLSSMKRTLQVIWKWFFLNFGRSFGSKNTYFLCAIEPRNSYKTLRTLRRLKIGRFFSKHLKTYSKLL